MTDKGKFQEGDLVKFKLCFGEDGAWQYGYVEFINKGIIWVTPLCFICHHKCEYYNENFFCSTPEQLTYIPPVKISKWELVKYLRGDIFLFEESPDFIAPNVILPENVEMTIDDLLGLLKNLSEKEKTASPINNPLYHTYAYTKYDNTFSACVYSWYSVFKNVFNSFKDKFPKKDFIYDINDIFDDISSALDKECKDEVRCDFSGFYRELKELLEDRDLPVLQRRYPERIKKKFVAKYNSFDVNRLDFEPDDYLELYRQSAEELAEKGDKDGLYAIAYGCYGGNAVFPCDWDRSREYLEKLFEDKEDEKAAYYANSLGYIAYYGRCNGGIPDYEKAFLYFSYAAVWDMYEAKYKLADMYTYGYYVAKSISAAHAMLYLAHWQTSQDLVYGLNSGYAADTGLRLGDIIPQFYKSNNQLDVLGDQLYFYLQANLASKIRMLYSESYGNAEVDAKITERIENIDAQFPNGTKSRIKNLHDLIDFTMNLCPVKMNIKKIKKEKCFKINIKVRHSEVPVWKYIDRYLPRDYFKIKCRLFVTNSLLRISGFYDKITLIIQPVYISDYKLLASLVGKDITVDKTNKNDLYCDGKLVLSLDKCYIYLLPPKEKKSHRMAVVNFGENNDLVKIGDEDIYPGDVIFSKSHNCYGKVLKIANVKDNMLFAPAELFD